MTNSVVPSQQPASSTSAKVTPAPHRGACPYRRRTRPVLAGRIQFGHAGTKALPWTPGPPSTTVPASVSIIPDMANPKALC